MPEARKTHSPNTLTLLQLWYVDFNDGPEPTDYLPKWREAPRIGERVLLTDYSYVCEGNVIAVDDRWVQFASDLETFRPMTAGERKTWRMPDD